MSEKTFYFILSVSSLIFGTTMGAYFGTMEYRIRKDLPLLSADCICPSCHHRLSILHQLPILSYFALHGRCHYCHAPIPYRYPLTETVFLLYYTITYCLFHRHPAIYLGLWFLFMSAALICRGYRHISSLLRALGITGGYHLTITLIYLIIYQVNSMQ